MSPAAPPSPLALTLPPLLFPTGPPFPAPSPPPPPPPSPQPPCLPWPTKPYFCPGLDPPFHSPGGLVERQGNAADTVVQPLGRDVGGVARGEGEAVTGRPTREQGIFVVDAAYRALATRGLRGEVTRHPAVAGEARVVRVLRV